jgi:pterin-4a-carbinolamine dehydratase
MSSSSQAVKVSVESKPRRKEPMRRPPGPVEKLKAERVQERLAAMPAWSLTHGGTAVSRAYDFPDSRVASSYASFVSDFASAMNVPVSMSLSGGRITLKLQGSPRLAGHAGLTEAVLDFAEILG